MEIRRRPPNPKVRVAHLEYAVPHDDEEPRHILEKIVWEKDREIDAARDKVPLDNLKQQIRAAGADAALLIAAILTDQDLHYLSKVAATLGLAVLVEVHDSDEMERVLNLGGSRLALTTATSPALKPIWPPPKR